MSTPTTISTSRRSIDLAAFAAADVEILDVAVALSKICRFTGHTSRFYSVAEHAVRCSYLVPAVHKFEALLHDAHEAYIGDISTPMKHAVPALWAFEAEVEQAVRQAFDLPASMSEIVRRADRQMLILEAGELLGRDFGALDPAFHVQQRPSQFGWSSQYAFDVFVNRFHTLQQRHAQVTR